MIKKILTIGIIGITLTVCIITKNIEITSNGMLITFRDNTGYYLEK